MLDKARVEGQTAVNVQYGPANPKHVKIIQQSTDILLIAPHACIRDGKPKDDKNTGLITEAVARQIGCSAIINTHYHKPDDKEYPPGYKPGRNEYPYGFDYDNLDLNDIADAEQIPGYLGAIRSVVDAPGKTTVIWIHGADDKKAKARAKKFKYPFTTDEIHAFIGYGQGKHPGNSNGRSRYTAELATVKRFRDDLISNGMNAVLTNEKSTNYRGRSELGMNQWFRKQKYPRDQVESIQLEIRNKGFRNSKKNAENTGAIFAKALKEMFPDIAQVAEKSKMTANTKASVVVHDPKDVKAAEKAYKKLSDLFKKHITAFMLEAGQYIIDRFYGGDARLALAKNKSKDNPPSLNLLIEKLQQGPEGESGDAPSVSWFYKAVSLAAHEAICQQMGLSTFTILGHSHKLQLLNVPKLKKVKGNEFDKAIEPAFKIKERLAKHAHDNNLTVRGFKEYIDAENPRSSSIKIDWNDPPSQDDLVKLDHKVLIRHWNEATKKIQNSQEVIGTYGTALNTLEMVLAEQGKAPVEGEGRFRDWTEPENNYNICRGCSNDCLYCYAKPGIGFRCKVEKGKWHQMEIVDEKVKQPQRLKNGLVGFPSTHDIVPGKVLDAYLTVLGKFLRAGNEVLIVTKPRLECIKAICYAADPFFKDKIIFRFTIGAMADDILGFWEPNAPAYQERKECLQYAFQNKFRTSVSMEPLLAMDQVHEIIAELRPFVSEDENIWIGTMNHLTKMKKDADEVLWKKIDQVEKDQSPEALKALYDNYKDDPLIQWKTDAKKAIFGDGKKKFKGWPKAPITTYSGEIKNVAAPVIISATRRSDIPARHADQFMESLLKGHIRYNLRGNWHNVSIANTRFIVFWTKNPRPMMFQHLDEIDQMGIGYYFLYTLNDYEQEGLEPGLPVLQERIDTFKELADKIGKERVVWRFDPLILADKISRQALIDKVGAVMTQLAGYTEKMVFSFLDPSLYNASNKLKAAGYQAKVFSEDKKAYIAMNIAEMAEEQGIQAAACADPTSLSKYGIHANKCVDDALIRRSFSQDEELMSFLDSVKGLEHDGQRDHCHCIPSYDIGTEHTCRNGCVYCYANASEKAVENQLKRISNESGVTDQTEDANDTDPSEPISSKAIVSDNSKTPAAGSQDERVGGEFSL